VGVPVVVQLQAVEVDRGRVVERLADRAAEGVAQAVAGHRVEVDVDLAGGGFEVFAGAAADVEDVAVAIDQHGGRGEALLDQLVGEVLEAVAVVGPPAGGWRGADGAAWESSATSERVSVLMRLKMGLLVHGAKQVAKPPWFRRCRAPGCRRG
jgi:hypothetical protein